MERKLDTNHIFNIKIMKILKKIFIIRKLMFNNQDEKFRIVTDCYHYFKNEHLLTWNEPRGH